MTKRNMTRRGFLGTMTAATVAGVSVTVFAPKKARAAGPISLAFVPKALNNPVFEVTRWGAEDRIKELGGDIKFRWVGPTTTDAAAQAQIIDDLVIQGVDGICVSCNDPDALVPAINRAVNEGVVVITWDADSPKSRRMTNVSINQEAAGAEAGKIVAQMAPKGKLAILTGTPGALNLEQRVTGFRSVVDQHAPILRSSRQTRVMTMFSVPLKLSSSGSMRRRTLRPISLLACGRSLRTSRPCRN